MSRCHILVFLKNTAPQWILWMRSREDWSICASKLIEHSADTTRVSRSPAGPAVLWTFLIWLIWNFVEMLKMGAAYSSLGRTKVFFLCSCLSTPRCKSQVPAKETKCQLLWKRFLKCADMTRIHFTNEGYTEVFCRLNILQSCVVNSQNICLRCWCRVTLIEWHLASLNEPQSVISNKVVFWQV